MSNPIIPVIPSGKVTLSKEDTASLLAAVLVMTPLPTGKSATDVRSYQITVNKATGTSNVNLQFN